MVHKNHPGAPIHPDSGVSGQMSVSAVTLCAMEVSFLLPSAIWPGINVALFPAPRPSGPGSPQT